MRASILAILVWMAFLSFLVSPTFRLIKPVQSEPSSIRPHSHESFYSRFRHVGR
jgi:hypothetical protein